MSEIFVERLLQNLTRFESPLKKSVGGLAQVGFHTIYRAHVLSP